MRRQVQYRLLVVRLGAMGDILHALPAITALRKAHPSWIIDWAIDPRWLPLLTAEPAGIAFKADSPTGQQSLADLKPLVNHIHLVPAKDWSRKPLRTETWAAIRALRSALKASAYDAVLDLQGSIRSAVVARLTGCRRILGEAHPRETPARWLFTERVETAGQHVVDQDIELAGAIAGDLLAPTNTALPLDPEAEAWCDQQEGLRQAEWTGKAIILIHPGGGWGAKRWPPERYAAVAQAFAQRGALVLVNAGPREDALAAIAAGLSPIPVPPQQFGQPPIQPIQPAVIRSTLPQLIALTRRVTLVIGGDTGPVHLASALGKPVVGIYGPTDPRRNGPYGTRSRILRNPESRTDHTRREQPEAGLLTITPQSVITAAIELMLSGLQNRQANPQPYPEQPFRAAQSPIIEAAPIIEAVPILEAAPTLAMNSETIAPNLNTIDLGSDSL